MNDIIVQAIQEQRELELRYSGYFRTVEPHAYGRDKDGDEILRCYQVSGGSVSSEKIGWKILKVHEIFSLNLLKEKFNARTGYKRGDKAMEYIFSQL